MRPSRGALVATALLSLAPGLAGCNVVPGQVKLAVSQSQSSTDPDTKFHEIDIEVANAGTNTARNISVRDSLPTGFTYASTITIDSPDAIRTRTVDPAIGTPSPVWGAWSLPPAVGSKPTTLTIKFLVAVGRAPSRRANFVEATSSDTDPVAARPMALSAQATALLDLGVSTHTPLAAGQNADYLLSIRNAGSASARCVFISASLPPGFVYASTSGISGNSLRGAATDPFADSLLPAWGSWEIPPAQFDGTPGLLSISFSARTVADTPPGVYGLSVTVTYGQRTAGSDCGNQVTQTVDGQAPITLTRP